MSMFVLLVLVAALVLMAGVAVFNAIVDPYGILGTGRFPKTTTSEPGIKADLIAKLHGPPQLIVLGSSRAMHIDPSFLREQTGLETFNAAVSVIGGAAETWTLTNYLHDRFPSSRPAYLWLVDVETFNPLPNDRSVAEDPRLARYLDQTTGDVDRARQWWNKIRSDAKSVLSWSAANDSLRILRDDTEATNAEIAFRSQFQADGGRAPAALDPTQRETRVRTTLRQYTDLYKNVYHSLDPQAMAYVEQTLTAMNREGSAPLIVLSPISPLFRERLGPLGWRGRHEEVLAYFDRLGESHQFTFVDMTSIESFGGAPSGFEDGVHMLPANVQRLLVVVLREHGDALGLRAPGITSQTD